MENGHQNMIRVIACGALAREIKAVTELNDITNIVLDCLPAGWHNTPDKIAPGVQTAIKKARDDGFEHIFIAYADCGTGGQLDSVCTKEGVKRLSGPHCYSFFSGNDLFAKNSEQDMTAFFLTDFLARQFETLIIKPYKLDKHPELITTLFAHYTKLIYLAQTDDKALYNKAKNAAEFLGLEFEQRHTGYGDLSSELIHATTGK